MLTLQMHLVAIYAIFQCICLATQLYLVSRRTEVLVLPNTSWQQFWPDMTQYAFYVR